MNRINLDNYEAYLLDYAEGKLNAQSTEELEAFLATHPGLSADMENTKLPYLITDDLTFGFKQKLKKTGEPFQDEELIRYIENDFNEIEKAAFEKKLATDKELAAACELYQKTILIADKKIVFLNSAALHKTENDFILKNHTPSRIEDTLKKEGKIIPLFNYRKVVSAAAALLLLVGLFVVIQYYFTAVPEKKLAETSQPKLQEKHLAPVTKTTTIVSSALHANKNEHLSKSKKSAPTGNVSKIVTAKKKPIQTNTFNTGPQLALPPAGTTKDNPALATATIEVTKPVIKPDAVITTQTTSLANNETYTMMSELAFENDDEDKPAENKKPNFWHRVVRLAQKANSMGIKTIEAEENPGNSFLLSFKAFSVEKK